MKFKVESLRLRESHWGGYYLGIDFTDCISTGLKISKKRYFDLKKELEEHLPELVIE